MIRMLLIAMLFCATAQAQYSAVRLEDGALFFDGTPYADLEGNVLLVERDLQNGDIGFAVKAGDADFKLKFMPAGDPARVTTVAPGRYLYPNGQYAGVVVSAGGAEITADDMRVLARGAVLSREGSVVRVYPDGTARAFPTTGGWSVSRIQPGNVGETEHLAIKRPLPKKGLITLKPLEEYALINAATGRVTIIPMHPPAQLPQSYETDLRKRFDWEAIGDRVFAATLTDTLRNMVLTDLATGESKLAGSRGLGIDHLKLERQGDKLVLSSDIGMIGDVVTWFGKASPYTPD